MRLDQPVIRLVIFRILLTGARTIRYPGRTMTDRSILSSLHAPAIGGRMVMPMRQQRHRQRH